MGAMKLSHIRIYLHEDMSAGGDWTHYYGVSLIGRMDTTEPVPCDPYKTAWYKASEEWFCERMVKQGLLEHRYAVDIAEYLAEHYGIDVIDTTED